MFAPFYYFNTLCLIISYYILLDKPPIEDLQYFLEFQIARVWAPELNKLQRKEPVCQSLQFSLMGPKLYISPDQVFFMVTITTIFYHVFNENEERKCKYVSTSNRFGFCFVISVTFLPSFSRDKPILLGELKNVQS